MSALQLEVAAAVLGPLLDELVFVGGATVHLWITDPGVPPVRATDDVDVICEVASRADYYRLGDRLRGRGLREAADERVICRWRSVEPRLVIDVMPTAPEILGFSNKWYGHAISTAATVELASGATLKAASPVLLAATKLCAWRGRGRGDLLGSLDVHDLLTLVNGRPELVNELEAASTDLRSYVRDELRALRHDPYFAYAVEGALAGYGATAIERARLVSRRIDAIVA
jgi:predicted nucleotidyltransferase